MNLLQKLKAAVAIENKATTAVLHLLIEAEDSRIYAEMAYPSLLDFCVRELGYSESSAYRRIQASRLLRRNSEVAKKIENGELSLSNAAQAEKTIRNAEKEEIGLPPEEIIEAASNRSMREAEKEISKVAEEFGYEKPEPYDPDENLIKKMRAHFKNDDANKDELFRMMAQEILDQEADIDAPVKNPEAAHVPKKLWQAVSKRDDHQCSIVINGKRCTAKHNLQCDHIVPRALGGKTEASNMRMLCQTHNLMEAERHGLDTKRHRQRLNTALSP